MKRLGIVLAGLVAVGWLAVYAASGQDGAKGKEGDRKDAPPPAKKLWGEQAKMIEICGLTAEQQKHVGDLIEARDKEVREIYAKYQSQITDVLTPEQRGKWAQWTIMSGLEKILQRANLTEEQLAKVRAAVTKLAGDSVPADEKARGETLRKMMDFLNKEVLTEEQKKSMWGGGDRKPEGPRKDGAKPEGPRKDGGDKPPTGDSGKPPREGDLPPL